jgi:hypothetical protein
MKRGQSVNKEKILLQIIDHCKELLKDEKFLINNDWETDVLLLHSEKFLKQEKKT